MPRDSTAACARFEAIRPALARSRSAGGLNRPPMERTAQGAALFRAAREIARRDLDMELEESASGRRLGRQFHGGAACRRWTASARSRGHSRRARVDAGGAYARPAPRLLPCWCANLGQ